MKTLAQVVACFPPETRQLYDFSNAVYKGALLPIENIGCPTHGSFQQYAAQLRKGGAGCPACGHARRGASQTTGQAEFVRSAEDMHPGRFTYEKAHYTTMHEKVVVTCADHGDFSISPSKLIHAGQGCPQCGAARRGIRTSGVNVGRLAAETSKKRHADNFVAKARAVHGDLYDYSQVMYFAARKDVDIICRKHGVFSQRVESHLKKGYGCPHCGQKSKGEDAVYKFLSVFAFTMRRDRTILKPKELDILLPDENLAVEYCGMFWHSHGDAKTERTNKRNHFGKYQKCADAGIRLLTVYETEWLERPQQVKRILRAALGKLKGRVLARKCAVQTVPHAEALAFFDKYHIQGGSGHGEHYGLYWKGKLVACMRFTYGSNDRGNNKNREWTLSRYATRVNVVSGASRLFTHFLREKNPPSVKSFSDNRYYSGGMYQKLGFTLAEEISPDYQVWSPKLGLRPKPHYQRRLLQQRLLDHASSEIFDEATDPRTEAEMTYLMGARRIYDCGKKRWLWTAV